MARSFAHEPDEKVDVALERYGDRLREQLGTTLTRCTAGQIGEIVVAITDGIRFRRHQIQNGGAAGIG